MPKTFTSEEKLQRAACDKIIVDQQDVWLLEEYAWHIDGSGYARRGNGTDEPQTYLHHCIVGSAS